MYQKQEIQTSPLIKKGTRDHVTGCGTAHAGGCYCGLPHTQSSARYNYCQSNTKQQKKQ